MAKRRRGFSEETLLLLVLLLIGLSSLAAAMVFSVVVTVAVVGKPVPAVLEVVSTPEVSPTATPMDGETPTPGDGGTPTRTSTLTPTPTPGPPDLVVTSLKTTGSPSVNANDSVEVPIAVVVRNQGGTPAGIFKVAIEYTGGAISPSSTFVVRFTVLGQSGSFYPFTTAALAADADRVFEGTITFNPAERGVTVSITATADSCAGDEFVPEYCRVEESDEGNNTSDPSAVRLPPLTPTPTPTPIG